MSLEPLESALAVLASLPLPPLRPNRFEYG